MTRQPHASETERGGPPQHLSRAANAAVWGVPILIACLIWIVCFAVFWHDFSGGDVFEYADIARNVVLGRGYIAQSLWLNDLPVGSPPYDYPLHRSPLSSAYLIPGIAMGGETTLAILVPSLLLFAVLAGWTGWLGTKLSDGLAGVCAAALYLTNANVLVSALSGLPTLLFGAIVTALIVVLSAESISRRRAAAAGLLAGMGYLTRPNMAFVTLGLLVLLVLRRRLGIAGVGLLLGGVLLVVAPSLLANYWHSGTLLANSRKYVTLFETAAFPGASIHDYPQPPDPLAFYRAHPGEFVAKVARQAAALPRTWWTAFRLATLLFVVVGVFAPGGDARESRLRELALGAALGQICSDLLTVTISRFWIPLVPVACILAGSGLARTLTALWRQSQASSLFVAAAVVALSIRPWWGLVPAVLRDEFEPKPHRAVARAVAQLARDPRGIVAASDPASIAWYADRRVLNLPREPDGLLHAEKKLGPISWLVVRWPERREWIQSLFGHPDLKDQFRAVHDVRVRGEIVARIFRRSL